MTSNTQATHHNKTCNPKKSKIYQTTHRRSATITTSRWWKPKSWIKLEIITVELCISYKWKKTRKNHCWTLHKLQMKYIFRTSNFKIEPIAKLWICQNSLFTSSLSLPHPNCLFSLSSIQQLWNNYSYSKIKLMSKKIPLGHLAIEVTFVICKFSSYSKPFLNQSKNLL